ncbi:Flp pilus assembly protein CpaB [Asticcacaulis taihuensis]|uniref:Pilus assembly protein CpaB n=1 Tax=Asticcacaulis taihuensis TaxID=260084 RepID=A0A1G4RVF5_9CAUL|nr:Flp pilus assembly protein CpaB [Asticcacaulis taihuensis]SCW60069.1 pilus assembly protein CpaB [Asticcacaulis taihuensis]
MNMRTVATFAIAILLGLIAVIVVRGLLLTKKPSGGEALAAANTTQVVVAAVPLARGAELKPAMLKIVSYPKDGVPANAFASVEQIAPQNGQPRIVIRDIAANEPVLPSKISGAGGKTNLSGELTPGMRAISVKSSDVAGVGGFVLPGDRVDILITRSIGSNNDTSSITQVLAENALVLGVDQTSDQETDKPVVAKAVTVEVSPDQAQAISLAQSVGEVTLALRSISDDAALTRKVTTIADLSGPRPAAVGRPRPVHVVRKAAGPSNSTEVRVTRGVDTAGYTVGTN